MKLLHGHRARTVQLEVLRRPTQITGTMPFLIAIATFSEIFSSVS